MFERYRIRGDNQEGGIDAIPRGIRLIAVKLYNYGQSSPNKRISAQLSLQSRQSRVNDIQWRKRTKNGNVFSFDDIDWSIHGEKEFDLDARYDAKTGLADLVVRSNKAGEQVFEGTIGQVIKLLEFIGPLFDLPVAPTDKVLMVFTDVDVLLNGEEDALAELADFNADPVGWTPDSPDQCSDTEREVYFPNE